MARGKVGCGGREIMRALWGDRGRPESNEYADRHADWQRHIAQPIVESLRVVTTYVPESGSGRLVSVEEYQNAVHVPRPAESPRTSQKWAAARARHRNPEGE